MFDMGSTIFTRHWIGLTFALSTLVGLIMSPCHGPSSFAISSAAAAEFSSAQKTEIQSIIKDYLIENPEILRDALNELELRDRAAAANARAAVVADMSGPLYTSQQQSVVGNPDGKISLIEFFDYNCGYCKRALGDIAQLIKDNPDLRVVLKDLPILSPGSIEAARVAGALRNQFKGEKFWAFHQKLLSSHGPVAKAQALAVAKDLGADMDKLEKDMASPDIVQGIAVTDRVAKELDINGTPSFVLGEEVVVGAVGRDELQSKITNIRKCGKTTCS
ncbi:DsbA family protein [Beijerinckia indica]|uniref:DSBA oxidoreductase n=1 Tax=Beijerinckia indica subsp. indica (strain ATCC 9039 / DSM 1715 / NCIMB 8712) TaxID=395963 RepID=B2IC37_BEII9|nr:DsbA family protein [Beijerinckia indica]ACB95292.1 DSBA oxidoreductase [Beijerinckia indica subsp. indica ATCC 9039]